MALVDARYLLCYIRGMAKAHKSSSRSSHRSKGSKGSAHGQAKPLKKKTLTPQHPPQRGGVEMVDPRVQAQLKLYDEALALFHQQKFAKAKQELEKVLEGPSKELADRARMHVKIAAQRMKPRNEKKPAPPHEHNQRAALGRRPREPRQSQQGRAQSGLHSLRPGLPLLLDRRSRFRAQYS